MVFMVYMLSSGGAVIGYFLAGRTAASKAKSYMRRMVLIRSALVFLLFIIVHFVLYVALVASVILVLLGFAYAFFYILTLSLSMELIPAGRSGLFDGLVGLGAASGAFFGPFLAETLGFIPQFLITSFVFFLAFLVVKKFT
jgi:MFS family permease